MATITAVKQEIQDLKEGRENLDKNDDDFLRQYEAFSREIDEKVNLLGQMATDLQHKIEFSHNNRDYDTPEMKDSTSNKLTKIVKPSQFNTGDNIDIFLNNFQGLSS